MNLALLFAAIVAVESGGRTDAVGDHGRSVGPAQIQLVTVADCNRILGREEFHDADRRSLERSRQMFEVYTTHYGRRYGEPVTDEVRARVWNGGPRGPEKPATAPYWSKVSARM